MVAELNRPGQSRFKPCPQDSPPSTVHHEPTASPARRPAPSHPPAVKASPEPKAGKPLTPQKPFAWRAAHGMSATLPRLTPLYGKPPHHCRAGCVLHPGANTFALVTCNTRCRRAQRRYPAAGQPRACYRKSRHSTRPVWGVPVPLRSLLVNQSSVHANTVPRFNSWAGHPLTL